MTNAGMPLPPQPTPATPGNPAEVGRWDIVESRFRNLPVHTALLHTGKVLGFGGTGNDPRNFGHPRGAELYNPADGSIELIDQPLGGDVFCSGHTLLADGRLLVAGGTYKYDRPLVGTFSLPPFSGHNQSYLFDPVTESWERTEDMSVGRWYPSLIQLADNTVLAFAGLTEHFPWLIERKVERFELGRGWRHETAADKFLPLYPRLHLTPDGDVFYAGSYNTHYVFPFSISAFPTASLNLASGDWTLHGLPRIDKREEGSTVLMALNPPDYRARVLLMGGGQPGGKDPTADTEIIDLSAGSPGWRELPPMANARYYCYAVMLPNQHVLVLGGKAGERRMSMDPHAMARMNTQPDPGGDLPHDPAAILDCELFHPEDMVWKTVAAMQIDRVYHSGALLLPDGRVFASGSNPARGMNESRIEIYSPAYLFKGPRPTITSAPQAVEYGQDFMIDSPDAATIDTVAFIRAASTTHCFSTDQRYVGLAIVNRNAEGVRVSVPANCNLLPPGYYMLFVLRGGVPSVARFVQVGG
jgi:hypothetical protein